MLIVLKVLVVILIVVLCLILTLLLGLVLVPFHCKGTLKKNKEYEAMIDVSWLWGILGLEFVFLPKRKFISLKLFKARLVTSTMRPKPPEAKKEKALKKAEKKAKKKEKKKRQSLEEQPERIMATIQTLSAKALREVVAFLSSLFSSLKLKLSGDTEVGFTDPADTGMLIGLFYAIDGVFSMIDFKLYPNWEESTFRGNVTFCGRVWLADIIRIVVRLTLTSSIRKIWWPKAKEKIKFWGRAKPRAVER